MARSLKTSDLFFVFITLAGLLLFWVQIDKTGYLLYSSLILYTVVSVIRLLSDSGQKFKYPKWLFITVGILIVTTGIDRITLKVLNSSVFLICYILFILIQPKPAWITRP